MADLYAFVVEGLGQAFDDLESLDERKRLNAARAINKTAAWARAAAAREMRRQVAFPARYLAGTDSRLNVVKKARSDDLEAKIVGRRRATSLARFARAGARGKGVRIEVKPGVARFMPRSFLMKLRGGSAQDPGALSNLGLAVRTNGEKPKGAYKPVKINDRLWLLYGPSVDQVFRSVREDIAPDTEQRLADEFSRLMALGDSI